MCGPRGMYHSLWALGLPYIQQQRQQEQNGRERERVREREGMFVPLSPSQAGDTPVSARQPTNSTLSGQGNMVTAVDNGTTRSASRAASDRMGGMVDNRRLGTAAAAAAAAPTAAIEQRPTHRISLSEATQVWYRLHFTCLCRNYRNSSVQGRPTKDSVNTSV